MADFDPSITDFYAGDSLTVDPDIPVVDPSAIATAYFTVKVIQADADEDAVLAKSIGLSVGADGILTANVGAGTVNARFDLANAETLLLSPLTNPNVFAALPLLAPLQWEILLQTGTGNDYRAQGTIRAKAARLLQGH